MKPENRILSAIYAAFLVTAVGAGAVFAAVPERSLTPPRDATGEAYLEAVRGDGLQTDITYLASDADTEEPDLPKINIDSWFNLGKSTGWLLLALVGLAVAVVAYRSRNMLAETIGPRGARTRPSERQWDKRQPVEIDHHLVERLRAEPDPREGLRMVLQRFLALAAQENSIPVKRSLTTREIMQRLPGGFSHRHELETLAQEVERVVFGGHSIDPEHYQYCVNLAVPFLRRTTA